MIATRHILLAGIALLWAAGPCLGQQRQLPITINPSADLSLKLEVERAIDRGIEWLARAQSEAGWWSTRDHPAVTALALSAIQGDPSGRAKDKFPKAVEKGYAYLLDSVHEDGSIYRKKQLLNYNTSVSIMALLAADNPDYLPAILKARNFVVGLQQDYGEPGKTDTMLDGGIGYGSSYTHSDMSNTLLALEALHHTRHLVRDSPSATVKKLDWQAAISFLQNCQNLPSQNKLDWASDDPQNKGGFVYFPGNTKSDTVELPDGGTALRSYGSISYAGLLSYIYADLERSDPRVEAVFEWLEKNYTLEENPGMGPQGLFYYYHTMAKALSLHGMDTLETASGKKVNWRHALALKLIDLQNSDGHWVNDNGRWWENDPALVTSYALLALQHIHPDL